MKYCGGKFKLRNEIAKELSKYLPESNTFIDMFCGSCNISIAMLKKHPNLDVYANDISKPLITMFNALKAGWIPPDDLSKDQWIQLKADQDVDNPLTAFAGFGCSYAGKYFTCFALDRTGKRNYSTEAKSNLLKDLPELQKIQYSSTDYKQFPLPNTPVLIYCDIPYYNSNKDNQFKCWGVDAPFNHTDFYKWCEQTKLKGFTIIVSEYMDSIKDTKYIDNVIWSRSSKASVSNYNGSSKDSVEVLIKI